MAVLDIGLPCFSSSKSLFGILADPHEDSASELLLSLSELQKQETAISSKNDLIMSHANFQASRLQLNVYNKESESDK